VTQRHTGRFVCESDEVEFADNLAGRSRHPALHDARSGLMVKSLRALVKRQRGTVVNHIEQVRLLVCEGSRLAPTKVQLIALTVLSSTWHRERHSRILGLFDCLKDHVRDLLLLVGEDGNNGRPGRDGVSTTGSSMSPVASYLGLRAAPL
jgi:hypothetical protein